MKSILKHLCVLCLPSEIHVSAVEDDFTGVPLWFKGTGSSKGFEHFLSRPANGTFPVIRQVFEPGTFGNFSFSVPLVRGVNIAAISRLALVHLFRVGHFHSFEFEFPALLKKHGEIQIL